MTTNDIFQFQLVLFLADNHRRVAAVVEPLYLLVDVLAAIIPLVFEDNDPQPYHDSELTGQMRYDEMMSTDNSHLFLDFTRVSKDVFILLLAFLKDRGGLNDSGHICAGQKLMIYLTLLKGNSNREIHNMWQHSGSTISHILVEIMAFLNWYRMLCLYHLLWTLMIIF